MADQVNKNPFSIRTINEMTLITVESDVVQETVESLLNILEPLETDKDEAIKAIFLNFQNKFRIDLYSLRKLAQVAAGFKKKKVKFGFTQVNEGVGDFIKKQGMDSLFPIVSTQLKTFASVQQTAKIAPATPKQLTKEHFNALILGVTKTFENQCHFTVSAGKPKVRKDGLALEYAPFIGGRSDFVMGGFKGRAALCYSKEFYLKAVSKILNKDIKEVEKKYEDFGAEFLNVTLGQARAILNEKGFDMKCDIPSVIRPPEVDQALGEGNSIILPFQCDAGSFFLEIRL